jgi:alpha-glucosidase
MKIKRKIILLSFLAFRLLVSAQNAWMIDDRSAVFYPAYYNAAAHLPSPIFVRELVPQQSVNSSWTLVPHFYEKSGHTLATVTSDGKVDFYGEGEHYGDLRRNNDTIFCWNKDNGAYLTDKGRCLYQTHPWILGVRKDGTAFGVIADNTWRSKIYANDNSVTFDSEGPAFRVVVIQGDTPQAVLQELGKLSGMIALPPLWALGYQQSRFSYVPDTKAKNIADEFRQRHIPCDAIWMDINYLDGFRIFTFSPHDIPDPKGLNDYLHVRHFKTVYMIDPGVKVDSTYFVYQQGEKGHYWVQTFDGKPFVGRVWPGDCNFPDFTRPEVRSWWSGLYRDFLDKGVDGVWNDMNEPSVFNGKDGTMPEDNWHLGGDGLTPGPHLRYHNVFGYYMVKGTREGLLAANPSKRPFVLSRSNFLGGQRYAATWTGDNVSCWNHLIMSIPMTLNMGLTGQPFNGPDIGGFAGNCNAELLAHWISVGVYFPFVRNHCDIGKADQEPWAFGKNVEAICRTAINRRYRLLPYIYSLFEKASREGQPIMQPVFFADLKDSTLRSEQKVFLLGPDLLVIPRWAKDAHLPKGDWKMLKLEDKDDLHQAILAQRPGSIVPLANVCQNTDEYCRDSVTLLVNPITGGFAQGMLYEDAGDGYAYRQGHYTRYEFVSSLLGKNLRVDVKVIGGEKPKKVKMYRIGFVTYGKISYSPWSSATSFTVPMIKDNIHQLSSNRIKWSTIDIYHQPSVEMVFAQSK